MSARIAHAPPVDERTRNQRIGWNSHDRVVEVLNLHDIQGYVGNGAVYVVLRHFDPVADAQHVVFGDHHACDQSQNSILEHQHQYGCESTQSRNQVERRFVDQDRNDNDHDDAVENHAEYLDKALHRAVFQLLVLFKLISDRVQYGIYGDNQGDEKIDPGDLLAQDEPGGIFAESEWQQGGNHQWRNDGRQLPKYAVFEHRFEESDAFAFQNLFRQMHQYGVDDSRDDECDNHDYDQKQEFVHFVEHMGRNADPGEEFFDSEQKPMRTYCLWEDQCKVVCIHKRLEKSKFVVCGFVISNLILIIMQ